ncbi:unnamed protein product [Urochloa humidicola]
MMGGLVRSSSERPRRRSRWADEANPYACLPQEMVAEILARLPVKPLLRFRSVCKSWRGTIDDPSFARAHLQHQPSSLLVFPCSWRHIDDSSGSTSSNSISLYRWAPGMPAARLVHAADMPPEHYWNPDHHVPAHCDGLVLVHTGAKVHLLNPAARQAVTLPWSPGSERPRANLPFRGGHQALGLGRDPRSGAYKVARFFYRLLFFYDDDDASRRGRYVLTTGMEVLTLVGGATGHSWREIAAQPPFPAMPDRTATFVKGSLLWHPHERHHGEAPGFLRLSLDDEALGVTPPPPCQPRLDYATCGLAELRGELCVARMAPGRVLEMWMADDAVRPRWERRYAIQVDDPLRPAQPRPLALLDDATIVMHDIGWMAYAYHLPTGGFQEIHLETIDYRRGDHPSKSAPAIRCFSHFVLIPYRESLLPVQ